MRIMFEKFNNCCSDQCAKIIEMPLENKKFLERVLIIVIKFLKKEDQNLLSLRIEKIC